MKKIKTIIKEENVERYMKEHFDGVRYYTNQEINELYNEYINTHNPEVKNELIEANIRRVVTCAYNVHNLHPEVELDELVSVGLFRLGDLIDRYKSTLNTPFVSYINSCVTNIMINEPAIVGNNLNLNGSTYNERRKIEEFIKKYKEEHGRKPDSKYISQKTGIKENRVNDILRNMREPLSLDVNDAIVQNGMADVENRISREKLLNFMESRLSDKQRDIVISHFGLNREPQTLAEIGKRYGVTSERIRRELEHAFRRLRRPGRDYLDLRPLLRLNEMYYQLSKENTENLMLDDYEVYTEEDDDEKGISK